jgi:hypothetical protein
LGLERFQKFTQTFTSKGKFPNAFAQIIVRDATASTPGTAVTRYNHAILASSKSFLFATFSPLENHTKSEHSSRQCHTSPFTIQGNRTYMA